jgi:uncharacterized membrane protein YphA (DoxX/SURF4 family)
MNGSHTLWSHAEVRITNWMASYSVVLVRLSLGCLFVWFGVLKFFPNVSPAEGLATRTLAILTLGSLPPHLAMYLLALWETTIGLGVLLGVCPYGILALLFLHMLGTFTPLVLFPHDVFTRLPYAPTFEAQYILKNLVLISAGCVLGATSRGGAVIADPTMIRRESLRRPRQEEQGRPSGTPRPGYPPLVDAADVLHAAREEGIQAPAGACAGFLDF